MLWKYPFDHAWIIKPGPWRQHTVWVHTLPVVPSTLSVCPTLGDNWGDWCLKGLISATIQNSLCDHNWTAMSLSSDTLKPWRLLVGPELQLWLLSCTSHYDDHRVPLGSTRSHLAPDLSLSLAVCAKLAASSHNKGIDVTGHRWTRAAFRFSSWALISENLYWRSDLRCWKDTGRTKVSIFSWHLCER